MKANQSITFDHSQTTFTLSRHLFVSRITKSTITTAWFTGKSSRMERPNKPWYSRPCLPMNIIPPANGIADTSDIMPDEVSHTSDIMPELAHTVVQRNSPGNGRLHEPTVDPGSQAGGQLPRIGQGIRPTGSPNRILWPWCNLNWNVFGASKMSTIVDPRLNSPSMAPFSMHIGSLKILSKWTSLRYGLLVFVCSSWIMPVAHGDQAASNMVQATRREYQHTQFGSHNQKITRHSSGHTTRKSTGTVQVTQPENQQARFRSHNQKINRHGSGNTTRKSTGTVQFTQPENQQTRFRQHKHKHTQFRPNMWTSSRHSSGFTSVQSTVQCAQQDVVSVERCKPAHY